MKSNWMSVGFCALIFCGAASPAIAGPDDRTIEYTIYNDPSHPERGIRYLIELDLAYADIHGNQVGWEIERVNITRMTSNGAIDEVWSEVLPEVSTTDGLWWTSHSNPQVPATGDFTMPPLLVGFAANVASGKAAMDYSLKGVACSGNCGTEAIEVPATVVAFLQEVDEEEPQLDEDEEPVGVVDDPD